MSALSRRQFGLLVGGGVTAFGLASCTGPPPQPPSLPPGPSPSRSESLELATELAQLPRIEPKPLIMRRLADGLTPPSNRWFSGLVFGETPQPIFPLPLGVFADDEGFEVWVPKLDTQAKAIIGARVAGTRFDLEPGLTMLVTGYDVASLTIGWRDRSGGIAFEVRLLQGSPVVSMFARSQVVLTPTNEFAEVSGGWATTISEQEFGLAGPLSQGKLSLAPNDQVQLIAAPRSVSATTLLPLIEPLGDSSVSWEMQDGVAITRLNYQSPSLVCTMAHHELDLISESPVLGSYPSVYGQLNLRMLDELAWRTPTFPIKAELELVGLSSTALAELRAQVEADASAEITFPTDSYFGGKALFREAMLWSIARQVGADRQASALADRLRTELLTWAELSAAESRGTKCFGYDELHRSVIGLEPAFGSDELNDHHFHYGYFLYAAGVLAGAEPELAARLSPVFDLVAADIAMPVDTGDFPQFRNFDVYASHSWASGTAPFADGNNQESSSEAVNAWAGLGLWAKARGLPALEAQASWMHALEIQGAVSYWLRPDLEPFDAFQHEVLGMGWGSKRDYATWFSPDPAAILAIQVLPVSPSSDYLAGEQSVISSAVQEAVGDEGFGRQYTDWCLLYSAFAGAEAAQQAGAELAKFDQLDDGLTRSYLLAVLALRS